MVFIGHYIVPFLSFLSAMLNILGLIVESPCYSDGIHNAIKHYPIKHSRYGQYLSWLPTGT
ncbi:MAG: hypothetical protein CMF31_10260 [Kordiimonas sp.]|nr:hypothetical protein [Kordiimonas sp.]|tara:strand:- start:3147 stop:3329 length:183 start_codon:yes stop_codon:yes gene_type:complete